MPPGTMHINIVPLLAETHPYCHKWPAWIALSVYALKSMISGQIWNQTMNEWLDLEDILQYPEGKVHLLLMYSQGVGTNPDK